MGIQTGQMRPGSLLCAAGLTLLLLTACASGPGIWRSQLEDRGLDLELAYTAEVFRNTHGGIQTGDSEEYRGDISLFLSLDTRKAGWWHDGDFFVHLQQQHGDGITRDHVGDFQVLSNIDADDFAQVSEAWYRHRFPDDQAWVKVGKQDATADFVAPAYGVEFIHSSPGYSPTIPLVTYPDPDWGIAVGAQVRPWLSLKAGLYQGRPDGGRAIGNTLDSLHGPMVLLEPGFHYAIGDRAGALRLGGWWNGDSFEQLDKNDPSPGEKAESYGWYLTWDQHLWPDGASMDGKGIGVFGQYGWAPEDRSEAEHYLGAGLSWTGAVPTRDDDALGLGVFHVVFSDEAGFKKDSETAIELFYRVQLFRWLSIKADVQCIFHPGGSSNPYALPVGLRMDVRY
jgi:porin